MARASFIVCFSLLLACFLQAQVNGAAITWTGAAGNALWNFANNWSPNSVPTSSDDVTINVVGGTVVTISQPAAARSIVIGGNAYAQSLSLLSQLSVGGGGIRVLSGATLSVQTNNALPLSSTGLVSFASGSQFNFQSGAIYGPGGYTVNAGATLLFSQAALKMIASTNLTAYGIVTIQSCTIQLTAGAKFYSYGTLNALNGITMLSSDNTGSAFVNYGTFAYNGNDNTKPLELLVSAIFYNKLVINSGRLLVGGQFWSNQTVDFTAENAMLEVQAGPSIANFADVDGQNMLIGGNARFAGSVSVLTAKVADSGSATFSGDTLFSDVNFAGRVNTSSLVRATVMRLTGGNLQSFGGGSYRALDFIIQDSASGNTNNFINSHVVVVTNASIYEDVFVLFGANANLEIVSGALFDVRSSASFVNQAGFPIININGFLSVEADAGYLSSNVRFNGTGTIRVNSGKFDFTATQVAVKYLFIDTKAFVNFVDCSVNVGSVSGTGGMNVSSLPGSNTFGTVEVGYLGFVNGPVSLTSFVSQTTNIMSSSITLAASSSSKTQELYFSGGSITGKDATINTRIFQVGGPMDQVLDGVHIIATSFKLITGNTGALLTRNGASITVQSSPAQKNVITL